MKEKIDPDVSAETNRSGMDENMQAIVTGISSAIMYTTEKKLYWLFDN